jgi:hypothetical protein
MCLVERPGECLEGCFGMQRVGVAVRGAHLLGDRRRHRRVEVAFNVADLVQLTALDDRPVEDLADRRSEGLGAVDHHQDRTTHIETTIAKVGEKRLDDRGVLG